MVLLMLRIRSQEDEMIRIHDTKKFVSTFDVLISSMSLVSSYADSDQSDSEPEDDPQETKTISYNHRVIKGTLLYMSR